MSKDFGRDFPRDSADLAALDLHYVIPEAMLVDFSALVDSVGVVGVMAEASDHNVDAAAISLADVGALNHALHALGKRLLADLTPKFGAPQA